MIPQVWMTRDELAGMLECSLDAVEAYIRQERLPFRQSHDGKTRVKLNLQLIGVFIAKIKVGGDPLEQAIQDIRRMHALMLGYEKRDGRASAEASMDDAIAAVGRQRSAFIEGPGWKVSLALAAQWPTKLRAAFSHRFACRAHWRAEKVGSNGGDYCSRYCMLITKQVFFSIKTVGATPGDPAP